MPGETGPEPTTVAAGSMRALGLALQPVRRGVRRFGLGGSLPFLGLRWPRLQAGGAARERSGAPAMVWPAARWLAWPVREAGPARAHPDPPSPTRPGPPLRPAAPVVPGPHARRAGQERQAAARVRDGDADPPVEPAPDRGWPPSRRPGEGAGSPAGTLPAAPWPAVLTPALRWAPLLPFLGQSLSRASAAEAVAWLPPASPAAVLVGAVPATRGERAGMDDGPGNTFPVFRTPREPAPAEAERKRGAGHGLLATEVRQGAVTALPSREPEERAHVGETLPAVSGSAPGVAGALLPAAAPPPGFLHVLPDLAIAAAPAGRAASTAQRSSLPQQESPTIARATSPGSLPWPRTGRERDDEPRDLHGAPHTLEPAVPLPPRAHEQDPGREPGPYARTPLQGLALVTGIVERVVEHVVEHVVEREVRTWVERQRQEAALPGRDGRPAESRPAAPDVTSDEVVRTLMQRMRALAGEERFRLGRLR